MAGYRREIRQLQNKMQAGQGNSARQQARIDYLQRQQQQGRPGATSPWQGMGQNMADAIGGQLRQQPRQMPTDWQGAFKQPRQINPQDWQSIRAGMPMNPNGAEIGNFGPSGGGMNGPVSPEAEAMIAAYQASPDKYGPNTLQQAPGGMGQQPPMQRPTPGNMPPPIQGGMQFPQPPPQQAPGKYWDPMASWGMRGNPQSMAFAKRPPARVPAQGIGLLSKPPMNFDPSQIKPY